MVSNFSSNRLNIIFGFKENLGLVYFVLPFISVVENKVSLICSILFGKSDYKIKIKNNIVKIPRTNFDFLRSLLACLTYSISHSLDSSGNLEILFDENSRFRISLKELSFEDVNLLQLLYLGSNHCANFLSDVTLSDIRKQTYTITTENNKKIIITSDGIRFFLDSIHPGNTIIETFVREIHSINPKIDWNDKIVVDVGAECGDTPLYYANKGAKVYAFEPIPEHFDAMLKNIELNPHLSERIIPINSGIGKDGNLTFYQSQSGIVGNTSFVTNLHGGDAKKITAKCYSIKSVLEEFKIEHVDLLKMDCKFFSFSTKKLYNSAPLT